MKPNEWQKVTGTMTEKSSYPFWFLNHRLERNELTRQMVEMSEKGMAGFCLHPRAGLKTPYLSKEWWNIVDYILEEARRLGLKVWIYDEMHFPSGLANGKVLEGHPEHRMKVIRLKEKRMVRGPAVIRLEGGPDVFFSALSVLESMPGDEADPQFAEFHPSLSGGVEEWNVPAGVWELFGFDVVDVEGSIAGYFPNYLNDSSTRLFVELTHNEYARRYGAGHFGSTVTAFFTDEPCTNYDMGNRTSIAYYPGMEEKLLEEYGRSLAYYITAMHADVGRRTAVYRTELLKHLRERYCQAYFDVIRQACRSFGVMSTGHVTSDGELAAQIWCHYDIFEVFRYLDLPGYDLLFSHTWPARGSRLTEFFPTNNLVGPKLASSAAHLLEKPGCLSETFGAAEPWHLSAATIKRLTDWQLALGINVFSQHGLYYSIDGCRKFEWAPSHNHQPYWAEYGTLTSYTSMMTGLFKGAEHVADALIVYPNRSIWNRVCFREDGRLNRIEEVFESISMLLLQHQVDFDYIQEEILAGAIVEEGRIIIKNGQGRTIEEYRALFLPHCDVIEQTTRLAIDRCAEGGVPVFFLESIPSSTGTQGNVPEMKETFSRYISEGKAYLTTEFPTPWQEPERSGEWAHLIRKRIDATVSLRCASPEMSAKVLVTHWRRGVQDYYFVVNTSEEPVDRLELTVQDHRDPLVFHLAEGSVTVPVYSATGDHEVSVFLSLSPIQSLVLAFVDDSAAVPELGVAEKTAFIRKLPDEWESETISSNVLVLCEWNMTAGPADAGIRYVDSRRYSASFKIGGYSGPVRLALEGGTDVLQGTRVSLNGREVPGGSFRPGSRLDVHIIEADVSTLLAEGTNILTLEMHNDGTKESVGLAGPAYLFGNFAVSRSSGGLWELRPETNRLWQGSWTEQGYPFYSGGMVYRQTVEISEAELSGCSSIRLRVDNPADAITVFVNGSKEAARLWPPYEADILPLLHPGSNLLELTVWNTSHNIFVDPDYRSGLLGETQLVVFSAEK